MQRAGILLGVVFAHLVALVGCYHPDVKDCTVQCAAPTDCTGGQVCREDGWCAMPGVKDCPRGGDDDYDDDYGAGQDAAPQQTSDALDPCPQGCTNGSCVGGVCVIDCSAPDACENDVVCPANVPCRVICGDRACGHKIMCGLATSCEVRCMGEGSCADEILCNDNRCDVDCTGVSSCKKRTRCSGSCACDVACLGSGSCLEVSECPSSACKLGNGCSAQLPGCNTCTP